MDSFNWYDNDDLWVALAPFLFNTERITTTSGAAEGILRLLNLPSGAWILDLCCGQGCFAVELAKRGFRVTGVDRTAAFLAVAADLAQRGHLECEFIREDMLKFQRPSYYHAVISIFHSFGYHLRDEENCRVLRNAYFSLVDGGQLLIDMLSKEQIVQSSQFPIQERVGEERLMCLRSFDEKMERVEDRWVLESGGTKREFRTSARMYSVEELSLLLRACGFVDIRMNGGFDGRPYSRDRGRLLVIARKRGC
ncbi:MAG TPA: class I SAM-dependent methyltransferase [Candidatus Binatia bacterium]|jgi:SAM-dependent methyltransferase|nr:class I SAM-dependent methyltransferase [Candidatus Binatia bacterium]